MLTFGEKLRKEREARGITLAKVAKSTKISTRHLQALERNDFRWLPGGVYTKGFVRAYAEVVGLDAEPIVAALVREERAQQGDEETDRPRGLGKLSAPDPTGPAMIPDSSRKRGRKLRWRVVAASVAGALVLPAIAVLVYFLFVGSGGSGAREIVSSESEPFRGHSATETDVQGQLSRSVLLDDEGPPTKKQPDASFPKRIEVSIEEFGVGTQVINHELQGESGRFEEGVRVWFWTRVIGGVMGEVIHHVWIHDGQRVASIELTLGGPRWRTQSHKTMHPGSTGHWTVEAHDRHGVILARTEFTCVPGHSSEMAMEDATR